MIKSLNINNFKCHKNTSLTLCPLTLLTGTNSSGKTSVLQSLLLLRQSQMKKTLEEGIELNDGLCDIGTARDALCKSAESDVLSFKIETSEGECLDFRFNTKDRTFDSFIPIDEGLSDETKGLFDKLSLFTNDFQYISAARWGGRSQYPKNTRAAGDNRQISLSHGEGELVANFLYLHGSEQPILSMSGKEETNLLEESIYWESLISRGVRFDVVPGDDDKSYRINYTYDDGGMESTGKLSAENIGFGISYSLPVIVALLSAKPGSLIIIENPEAHLHTAGQAEMARLISLVAAKGVQVIVETHSDHIINGTLVNIKKQNIPASDVVIYYFEISQYNFLTEKTELQPDEEGKLSGVPEGFFDQIDKDLDILV